MSNSVSTKGSKATLKTDASAPDMKAKETDKHPKPVDTKTPKTTKAGKGSVQDEGGFFLTAGKQHEGKPAKQENVLVAAGLLDGYDYLQRQICKHGLPKGNVFEYAAITMLKYERKLKAKQAEKRLEEKEREKELEKEKAKKQAEAERGRGSPKHIDHGEKSKSPQDRDRSRSKSPAADKHKADEIKTKGKADKSPPPKDEPKGKADKSPQPKEEAKKGGDKRVADKSPPAKDDPKGKADDIKDDKNAKKGGKAEPVKPTAAKK
jgi:hypothetical protein